MSNTLFVQKGSKLKVENNNIVVKLDDTQTLIPIVEITAIIIENLQSSITAGVNVLCSSNNVPIIYCDNKHNPIAISNSFHTYYKQLTRIKEQISWTDSRKKKLFKQIVISKIINQITLLEYINTDKEIVYKIKDKLNSINTDNFEAIEAQVAAIYFKALFGEKFKRFEDDEINTSLNYGYAILRSVIKQTLVAKGLIPALGLWHKSQFNNFNLSDDIIEVYRPIVDYVTYHFTIRDDVFSKEEKMYLQNCLFQKVIVGKKTYGYRESIDMYIDNIIKYMNKEKNKVECPKLDCELYEY